MIEQVIVIRDKDVGLRGLIFVNEIDIGYIDKKVVAYCDVEINEHVMSILSDFDTGRVNIRDLEKELRERLINSLKTHDVIISRSIPFISGNKNKASRNKRLLEALDRKHFVRTVKHVGS